MIGAVVGLAAVSCVSCDLPVYDEPGAVEAYAGVIDDSDMMVGAVVRGGQVRVYVCGGPESFASSRWFDGDVTDGAFVLESRGWSLSGELIDGRLTGSLREAGGIEHSWGAETVAEDPVAGIYEARTGDCISGVVIQKQPDGGIEAQGAWCDGYGNFDQIIILKPLVATEKGIEVRMARSNGGATAPADGSFFVTRVEL